MRKQKEILPLNKSDFEFFQNFFEEYKNYLYHAASSYAATAADRDDLVQEAVMRLMKNIPVLRQLTRCKTAYYIVITVRTAYIDMLRRKQNLSFLPLNDDDDFLNALPENILTDRSETDMHLRMAVRQLRKNLSEKDWMVLVGKVIMGYTYEELGTLLEMNPASVRMVLSRAKAKARELLQFEDWIGGD
ncbi:MAG: sigma-70 family RNA polymerase sigma factor [Faecousia sp.]